MKLRMFLLTACLLCASFTAQATPVSVVLYPSGALVTEEDAFRPVNGRLTLQIPAGADEGSLEFSLSQGSVTGATSLVKEGVSARNVNAVRARLRMLDHETALTKARRESLAQQRRFWTTCSTLSGETQAQAKNLATRLETLAVQDAELSLVLLNLADERKALEQRLDALGRQNESVRECTLDVVDTGSEPVRVRWSYYLNDAGWQPRYRVQALQDAGKVRLAMDAVIRQGSGMDWENVETILSSSEDFRSVTPPVLPDWVIGGERQPARPRALNIAAVGATVRDESAAASKASAMPHASGLRWSLGKVDIAAGAQTTRPVDSHSFDATFFRLIRPTEDSRAWIMATLEEDALPLLPAGQASFLVDGVENARSVFRIAPGERDIPFGIDQLIGVNKHDLPTQSVESLAGTKASQWRWRTDIINRHDRAMDVRVESPAPILRDIRMNAKTKSKPTADFDEELSRYTWRLEVPALKTTSIVHEVTVTSPIDVPVENR